MENDLIIKTLLALPQNATIDDCAKALSKIASKYTSDISCQIALDINKALNADKDTDKSLPKTLLKIISKQKPHDNLMATIAINTKSAQKELAEIKRLNASNFPNLTPDFTDAQLAFFNNVTYYQLRRVESFYIDDVARKRQAYDLLPSFAEDEAIKMIKFDLARIFTIKQLVKIISK